MTTLRPTTPDEFDRWRAHSIASYAAEKVRAGRWTEAQSLAESESEFHMLLPQGLNTPGHWVFTLVADDGQAVGTLWLARAAHTVCPTGFIYDLVVWPAHRRQGHAAAALRALECEARALGLQALSLHVFGHNLAAQRLYARLGYAPTSIHMAKPLDAAAGDRRLTADA